MFLPFQVDSNIHDPTVYPLQHLQEKKQQVLNTPENIVMPETMLINFILAVELVAMKYLLKLQYVKQIV